MVPPYTVDPASSTYSNLGPAAVWSVGQLLQADHVNAIGTPWINVSHMLQYDLPWGDCFTCFSSGTARLLLQPPEAVKVADPHHAWQQVAGVLPQAVDTHHDTKACGSYYVPALTPGIATPVTWKQVVDRAPERLAAFNADLLVNITKLADTFDAISKVDWNSMYGMFQHLGYPLEGCNNHTDKDAKPATPRPTGTHARSPARASHALRQRYCSKTTRCVHMDE